MLKILASYIVVFVNLFYLTSCNKTEYTRSECIVRVDITSDLEQLEHERSITSSAKAIISSEKDGYNGPIPSMAVCKGRNAFYFQFASGCMSKSSLAKELVALRMQPAASDGFVLKVSNDTVLPGVDTIRVAGDAWKD